MLPTFVIGLREGLEAALIVGIVAAFLRKQGRRDLLRWVFAGVGVAVVLCAAAGIALDVVSHDLPQRQQEGLETVIGALAVGMVTYMVVWMKRNSRGLKGQLEELAADAMGGASGAARAMVAMAFLAVLREGVETVVFLLAAFNQSASGASSAVGACLGLAVAIGLGYGIYRGGVRINLSKFFRATGLVLVLVAAGILVNAFHTAHEAGWLDAGQQGTVDLTWLVQPGSVQASLLTGMLGVQPRPVLVEVVAWLAYLVPVGVYVAWPAGRGLSQRALARALAVAAVALAAVAAGFAVAAPKVGRAQAVAGVSVVSSGPAALVRTPEGTLTLQRSESGEQGGLPVAVYTARAAAPALDRPARLGYDQVAQLNGGRLPIGLRPAGSSVAVTYTRTTGTVALVATGTGQLLALTTTERVTARAGGFALSRAVDSTARALPRAASAAALAHAHALVADRDRRDALLAASWTGALTALLCAAGAVVCARPMRRRGPGARVEDDELVRLGSPN